jgi:hypothetical protein
MWSVDGYVIPCTDPNCVQGPGYSPTPQPGYEYYRAADHEVMSDERQVSTVLSYVVPRARDRMSAALGLVRVHSLTSVGGQDDESYLGTGHAPYWGAYESPTSDPFFVYAGDEPYFRKSESDAWTLRADYERWSANGSGGKAGLGGTYQSVRLRELDETTTNTGLDSLRTFEAFAPGGWAYAQGRWVFEGLVLNAGLRGEYFSAGPQAQHQSFAEPVHDTWSLSPRLGVAYPISASDVFSLAYVRVQQNPAREFLYDQRTKPNNYRPLGNPAIEPATVISWQAAIKHLIGELWSLQGAVFMRDVWGEVGARNFVPRPPAPVWFRYEGSDDAHATGWELSLIRAGEATVNAELHYTWMMAEGSESLEEGNSVLGAHRVSAGADRGQPSELGPAPHAHVRFVARMEAVLARVVDAGGLGPAVDAGHPAPARSRPLAREHHALQRRRIERALGAVDAAPGSPPTPASGSKCATCSTTEATHAPRSTATRTSRSTPSTTITARTVPRPATAAAPTGTTRAATASRAGCRCTTRVSRTRRAPFDWSWARGGDVHCCGSRGFHDATPRREEAQRGPYLVLERCFGWQVLAARGRFACLFQPTAHVPEPGDDAPIRVLLDLRPFPPLPRAPLRRTRVSAHVRLPRPPVSLPPQPAPSRFISMKPAPKICSASYWFAPDSAARVFSTVASPPCALGMMWSNSQILARPATVPVLACERALAAVALPHHTHLPAAGCSADRARAMLARPRGGPNRRFSSS